MPSARPSSPLLIAVKRQDYRVLSKSLARTWARLAHLVPSRLKPPPNAALVEVLCAATQASPAFRWRKPPPGHREDFSRSPQSPAAAPSGSQSNETPHLAPFR